MQLTIKPTFISSADSNEERTTYSKSDNSIIMIASNTDEIIQRLFDLLLNRFQTGLEQNRKVSNIIFDYISEMILL